MPANGLTSEAPSWLCWYCSHSFTSQAARTRHISRRHPSRNRLVPPVGFVELYHRQAVAPHRCSSAAATVRGARVDSGAVGPAPALHVETPLSGTTAPQLPTQGDAPCDFPLIGGLGVVRLPADASARGSVPVPRRRSVFQTSVAARIRAYYEAMSEATETRRLVSPSEGRRPSRFNTPLLRETLRFALSAGGSGVKPLAFHATWNPTFTISSLSNVTFHVARFFRDSLYASNICYNGLHLFSGSYGHADRPDLA